ncbi:MAG: tRNA pseudouridine(55) synthase TruB [Succinivibrio sp.]|nr:tRNA pseudouridine(55) synthase TruB [Succinivibrio sp.]
MHTQISRTSPPKKRAVCGILLLDKPTGISSSQALARVRGIFAAAKGGHTGALDPLASGCLPICLGEATKYSDFFLKGRKRYTAVGRLGQSTTTCDAEGEIIKTAPLGDALERLEQVLEGFRGKIVQVPPLYSAVKVGGKPLYRYARQGRGAEVEIPRREVEIYELKLIAKSEDSFQVEVYCSKGTYIRTLINDIGEALGCGAYVTLLRRLEVEGLPRRELIGLEELQAICDAREDKHDYSTLDACLCSVDECMSYLPEVSLTRELALDLFHGVRIGPDFSACTLRDCTVEESKPVQLRCHDSFIGVGHFAHGLLIPDRMMSHPKV